jgi:hypothetical protein
MWLFRHDNYYFLVHFFGWARDGAREKARSQVLQSLNSLRRR